MSFFYSGKSRNSPNSRNDVKHTKFNCKAVEFTEVNEKVISKKSAGKNHRWRQRIKKHSRTSPDVQFKAFSLTKQKTRPQMNY